MSENEQIQKRMGIGLIILAIASIFINGYFFFAKNYVRVSDNVNETEVVSIKYSEILGQEDSLSNTLSLYLTDEPAKSDSGFFEKAGMLGMISGAVLCGIGALVLYTKRRVGCLSVGALLSCLGGVVLFIVVSSVEKSVNESFIGTMESLFGKGTLLEIDSSALTLMILNIIVSGAVALLCHQFAKRSAAAPPPSGQAEQ